MKIFKKYLALPVILAALFLGGIVLCKYQNAQKQYDSFWEVVNREFKFIPQDAMVKVPEEFNANGVYENYTYGFHFEYPNDYTLKSTNTDFADEVFFPVQVDLQPSSEKRPNIDLSILKESSVDWMKPHFEISLLHEARQLNPGENIHSFHPRTEKLEIIGRKIKDISTEDGIAYMYHYKEPQGGFSGYKGVDAYSAEILINGNIYQFRMYAFGEETLVSFREDFEKIVKSFRLIASLE